MTPQVYSERFGFEYHPYLLEHDPNSFEEVLELGTLKQGESKDIEISIENTRGVNMTLGPPVSSISCCVIPELEVSSLESGERTVMLVRVETSRQYGPTIANIVVPFLFEGRSGAYIYRVNLDVNTIIEPDPPFVEIGKDNKAMVRIKSAEFSKDLQITEFESQPPGVVVTPAGKTKDSQDFEFDVAGLPETETVGVVKMVTNHKTIKDVLVSWSRPGKK